MKYASKPVVELIVGRLLASNILDIVISPGSRNAPFIQSFTSKPQFNCYSIVDERAAGFFALGMALKTKKPTVLLCTSGSALLNYYPAVAEAFYQKVPLIVLSADRPEYCVDQGQGQTIRQNGVLDLHIQSAMKIIGDQDDQAYLNQIEQELLKNIVTQKYTDQRPFHINVHLEEPLYDLVDRFDFEFSKEPISAEKINLDVSAELNVWENSTKKLIVLGQHNVDSELEQMLQTFEKRSDVMILSETTSNITLKESVQSIDVFLESIKGIESEFKPDVLIQFGGAIISKKIKTALKSFQIANVWSIQPDGVHPDIYFSITKRFNIEPKIFLKAFLKTSIVRSDYAPFLMQKYNLALAKRNGFLKIPEYADIHIYKNILNKLPKETIIHSANSSVIRYLQLYKHEHNTFYCNRGTSGIDGSSSTAIGFASQTEKPVCLFTGDISFFYDSNAFWNNYIPQKFKVILMNNGGGDIFRIIPGAKDSFARENYFSTAHQLNAKGIASTFGLDYYSCQNLTELNKEIDAVLANDNPLILEIQIPEKVGPESLKSFFETVRNKE
ncbi:MAG: 2-succinyl-5-enolpyruvyl-6-hydroxy-3-cyclohexene-1-carboxylic-acid synthase [Flavobacteriales bacterium]